MPSTLITTIVTEVLFDFNASSLLLVGGASSGIYRKPSARLSGFCFRVFIPEEETRWRILERGGVAVSRIRNLVYGFD